MAKKNICNPGGGGGAFYSLGMIGAFVYYIQQANGFGEILFGVLKAVVWPAFFVYRMYQNLGM